MAAESKPTSLKSWTEDLRIVIGGFFLILGLIVSYQGFANPPASASELNLNLICGLTFLVFSLGAIAWGVLGREKIVA